MKLNQKGFATLEIILMVMVVGILATMAVPQFEKITASANTAKVQSDLAAINSASAVYQMEKGTVPNSIGDLESYFENGTPQVPTGSVYIEGEVKKISATSYTLSDGKAQFMSKEAKDFKMKS